jgi:hypothetical protein
MFAYIQNNQFQYFISEGTVFTIEDIQYPANWLNLSTPEEKSEAGIVDVIYGPYPNDQYFWISQDTPIYEDGVVTVTYTTTPKDLTQCKDNLLSSVKQQAYSILLPSDWMVVKAMETQTAMSSEWSTWRQQIRQQASDQIETINACTTVEQLSQISPIQWIPMPS